MTLRELFLDAQRGKPISLRGWLISRGAILAFVILMSWLISWTSS